MTVTRPRHHFDLALRTQTFALNVRKFVGDLPRTIATIEDAKQLVRSSGSVGANYLEADESLSMKDQVLRLKICRKEAKESGYWLQLLDIKLPDFLEAQRKALAIESREIVLIFNAIVNKLT